MLESLEKTHTKFFIKHLTTQLTFGYRHGCDITRSKKENEINTKSLIEFISLLLSWANKLTSNP